MMIIKALQDTKTDRIEAFAFFGSCFADERMLTALTQMVYQGEEVLIQFTGETGEGHFRVKKAYVKPVPDNYDPNSNQDGLLNES